MQIAASPFEKKSCPPKNIRLPHGLSTGSAIVSTAYGAPEPRVPVVVSVCGHRLGPPFQTCASEWLASGAISRTSAPSFTHGASRYCTPPIE